VPDITKIADIVRATLPTIEMGKWDSVGLAQLYPEYEYVKQWITGAKHKKGSSYEIQTELEIQSPSSFEASFPNHAAKTSVPKQVKDIKSRMVKARTKATFSEDEKALQGGSAQKILDVVEMRMKKLHRDMIEGLEHAFLGFPATPDEFPQVLKGVLGYWNAPNSGVTDFALNGGLDPVGHPLGAGEITVAAEPRWANAVAKFAKISDDDFFDQLERFINQVRMLAVIPHPEVAPNVPRRVIYVQEPVKRAVSRYFTAGNDDVGHDAGVYRDANMFKSTPITIWHAMSSVDSPVRPTNCVVQLIDWNAFQYSVLEGFDQKITGPTMLPEVPGQMVVYNELWHNLHCTRRDRLMFMTSDNPDLQPDAS